MHTCFFFIHLFAFLLLPLDYGPLRLGSFSVGAPAPRSGTKEDLGVSPEGRAVLTETSRVPDPTYGILYVVRT